jgi:hypothetical protein
MCGDASDVMAARRGRTGKRVLPGKEAKGSRATIRKEETIRGPKWLNPGRVGKTRPNDGTDWRIPQDVYDRMIIRHREAGILNVNNEAWKAMAPLGHAFKDDAAFEAHKKTAKLEPKAFDVRQENKGKRRRGQTGSGAAFSANSGTNKTVVNKHKRKGGRGRASPTLLSGVSKLFGS